MRLNQNMPFKTDEKEDAKLIIHSNIINSMNSLISGAISEKLLLLSENFNNAQEFTRFYQSYTDQEPEVVTETLILSIHQLWQDPAIQLVHRKHSGKYTIQDTIQYFIEKLDEIFNKNYIPTTQDMLNLRAPTKTITSTKLSFSKHTIIVYDVAGQRTFRNKWVEYFESDISAIIYITALSSYDQKLIEDESVNRIEDSIELLNDICNHPMLIRLPVILLLNKCDVFQKKIEYSPISDHFPEFQVYQNLSNAKDFFKKKFELVINDDRKFYTHYTTNTDSKLTGFVISSVFKIVLNNMLSDLGCA